MSFSANARFCGERSVLQIAGELDVSTASRVAALVTEALRSGSTHLVVDVAGVTFMDCAALRVLLRARQASLARGGQLSLAAVPRSVRAVLALTGTQELIGPEPTAGVDSTARAHATTATAMHHARPRTRGCRYTA